MRAHRWLCWLFCAWSTLSAAIEIDLQCPPHLKPALQSVLRTEIESLDTHQVGVVKAKIDRITQQLTIRLQSLGYFRARVQPHWSSHPTTRLRWHITPGEPTRIAAVILQDRQGTFSAPGWSYPLEKKLLQATTIRAIKASLQQWLEAHRCYVYVRIQPRIQHHPHHTQADVVLHIDHSPPTQFGAVHFKGLQHTKLAYVRSLVAWQPGQCFQIDPIRKTEKKLFETHLFQTIRVTYPETPPSDGQIPVTFHVQERLTREVQLGLYHNSIDAVGLFGQWQHDNIAGAGETLKLATHLARSLLKFESTYHTPFFGDSHDELRLHAEVARKRYRAFNGSSYQWSVEWIHPWGQFVSWSAQVGHEYHRLQERQQRQRFHALSLPLQVTYDSRDEPLNSTQGMWLQAGTSLYLTTESGAHAFLKHQAQSACYHRLTSRMVWAWRMALGTLQAQPLESVPANYRFYAGGAHSVRGYRYQTLSAYHQNHPQGGLSWWELASEWRYRFNEQWGMVGFIDGGYAFKEPYFNQVKPIRWAVGLGWRYHHAMIPIRFDVAVPLTRRPGIDKAWQFYISMGQSF